MSITCIYDPEPAEEKPTNFGTVEECLQHIRSE